MIRWRRCAQPRGRLLLLASVAVRTVAGRWPLSVPGCCYCGAAAVWWFAAGPVQRPACGACVALEFDRARKLGRVLDLVPAGH